MSNDYTVLRTFKRSRWNPMRFILGDWYTMRVKVLDFNGVEMLKSR